MSPTTHPCSTTGTRTPVNSTAFSASMTLPSLWPCDRHKELATPGFCGRRGHKKLHCVLHHKTCCCHHSTLWPAWLQLGPPGMVYPHPVALLRFIDIMGLSLPAPWISSHSWSEQLLTFNKSPPQLRSTWIRRAFPLSCSRFHDYIWG